MGQSWESEISGSFALTSDPNANPVCVVARGHMGRDQRLFRAPCTTSSRRNPWHLNP